MEQRSTWGTDGQKIEWNRKNHYAIHKNQQLKSVLKWLNLVQIFLLYFLRCILTDYPPIYT